MVAHIPWMLLLASMAGCVLASLPPQKRVPKQIHTKAAIVETEDDHKAAETHFGGGGGGGGGGDVGGHGKYFMYQHLPHHDHYEFGYRRGNEHHFKERYEKAQPHHGQFKTKARWGDKHGGYGEHYWDYNHDGGHHGDDGGSSHDEGGDESDPVPVYQPQVAEDERVKRQPEETPASFHLSYDTESGTVLNSATGQRYTLTPIN